MGSVVDLWALPASAAVDTNNKAARMLNIGRVLISVPPEWSILADPGVLRRVDATMDVGVLVR